MSLSARLRGASRAALIHLGICLLIAAAAAVLVMGVWYPKPYDELTGARGLFLLLVVVDVVCGPTLTLVLYDPRKPVEKWRIDVALIAAIQLSALAYGVYSAAQARPIHLAFEGNRFRVVHMRDIDRVRLAEAPSELRSPPLSGPSLIGVRLSKTTDPDYPKSIQLAMQGEHPAFRPERWVAYSTQLPQLRIQLRPIAALRTKHPNRVPELQGLVHKTGLPEEELGYLPLVRDDVNDWVVVVGRNDGLPRGYLHMDGWQ